MIKLATLFWRGFVEQRSHIKSRELPLVSKLQLTKIISDISHRISISSSKLHEKVSYNMTSILPLVPTHQQPSLLRTKHTRANSSSHLNIKERSDELKVSFFICKHKWTNSRGDSDLKATCRSPVCTVGRMWLMVADSSIFPWYFCSCWPRTLV